jgi:hypothetical protein
VRKSWEKKMGERKEKSGVVLRLISMRKKGKNKKRKEKKKKKK